MGFADVNPDLGCMRADRVDAARRAAEQLEALAEEVEKRGFSAEVTRDGRRMCISVVNRTVPQLSENVYVAPLEDGSWWFWWSWADRLAPIDDVDAAAFKIAYVLTPA
jgi:hypothetical protein